jgi:hypothetical protein
MGDHEIAKKLIVIEWFPYHSLRFDESKHKCNSQMYSFGLAKSLQKLGRLVIGLCGERLWETKLAGLQYLKNPQSSYVSPGNMELSLFEDVKTVLHNGLPLG